MGSWVAKRVRASYSPVIPEPNHRPASREYLVVASTGCWISTELTTRPAITSLETRTPTIGGSDALHRLNKRIEESRQAPTTSSKPTNYIFVSRYFYFVCTTRGRRLCKLIFVTVLVVFVSSEISRVRDPEWMSGRAGCTGPAKS